MADAMEATVDTEDMVDMEAMEATGPAMEVTEDMVDTEATTDPTMEDMAAMVDTGPMVDMDTTAKCQSTTLYPKNSYIATWHDSKLQKDSRYLNASCIPIWHFSENSLCTSSIKLI